MRIIYILILLTSFSSCSKRKSKTTVHKHEYQNSYHYKKITKVESSGRAKFVNDSLIFFSSQDSVIIDVVQSEESKETIQCKKKKLHLASMGSVLSEGVAFGGYYVISQNVPTGIIVGVFLSGIGFLAVILSIAIAFMAYLHFLKFKQKFWGSGFSIFALYTTAITYLALNIFTSVILTQLGIPIVILISLASLLIIGYTYFFSKFIKSLKK